MGWFDWFSSTTNPERKPTVEESTSQDTFPRTQTISTFHPEPVEDDFVEAELQDDFGNKINQWYVRWLEQTLETSPFSYIPFHFYLWVGERLFLTVCVLLFFFSTYLFFFS